MSNAAYIIEDNVPMPTTHAGRLPTEVTTALGNLSIGQCMTCPLPEHESSADRRRTVGRYRGRVQTVKAKYPSRQYHQRTVHAEIDGRIVPAVRIWRTK